MDINLNTVETKIANDEVRTHFENENNLVEENLDPYTLAKKIYQNLNESRETSYDKLSQDQLVKLKIAMDYYNEAHAKNISHGKTLDELENKTKELFYGVYGKTYEEALSEYKTKGKTI